MQDSGVADVEPCDVLVIGGGPAGSTVATLLAERGRKVVMLEKDTHPRFHIGESLLPQNLTLLERLGVLDEVARIGVHKPGAEFVSDEHGGKSVAFRFADGLDPAFTYSFHVRRADFDELLFRNSQRRGVDAREGMRVVSVELDPASGSSVTAVDAAGDARSWRARFIVDASGRDTYLAGKLGTKDRNRHNNTAAMFGHFRGVAPLGERDEGNITIHLFEAGWFWAIPLPDGITSIGAVSNAAFFKDRGGASVEEFFLATIGRCPSLARRTATATLTTPVTATGNYSYQAQSMAGDGYILVGDAFAFIDPVFSSGVHLAMSSAALGAEAVDAWLDNPATARAPLRRFDAAVRRSLDAFSWLIYRINRPVLRDLFMEPGNQLRMRDGLVSLLAGNTQGGFRHLLPVWAFKATYHGLSLAAHFGYRLRGGRLVRSAAAAS